MCVWTVEQGNVVSWFEINDDVDDRKPVAQKTVRRRAASARDLQNKGEFAKVSIGLHEHLDPRHRRSQTVQRHKS
jgi:hypothetical protein